MAVTSTLVGKTKEGKKIFRHVETGGANGILAMSVGGHGGRRVRQVTVAYSGAPTQAGVSVALDSGAGAGYDSTLSTGTANARYTNYIPDGGILLGEDDALLITAPAGGGVLTSSAAVYTEEA
jgi:hypothetical protein